MCGICRQQLEVPQFRNAASLFPSLRPNGVRERYNYGGETLTLALPPFLARSPTFLLASKFHTPRIPIVFQVRIILNLLRSTFHTSFSYILHYLPPPHGVIKIIISVIILIFHKTI